MLSQPVPNEKFSLKLKVAATPECFRDDDCRIPEVCHTGSCVDACIIKKCGENAICSTTIHDIACTCRQGFTGNPRSGCSLCKCTSTFAWTVAFAVEKHVFAWLMRACCFLSVWSISVPQNLVEPIVAGCDGDDECPDYNACRNKKCINPCAEDDPCAQSANCKVIDHQPVCTCPDGFIGDPRTECRSRKNKTNHLIKIFFFSMFLYWFQLYKNLYNSSKTRVYSGPRMPYNPCLHQGEVPEPMLQHNLWHQSRMQSDKSPSNMRMHSWFYRRSL